MIVERKVLRLGKSSLAIVLPKEFTDLHHIGKGDTIQLQIELLDMLRTPQAREIKEYKCQKCSHVFCTDDEDVDLECPACTCRDVIENDFENDGVDNEDGGDDDASI